MGTTSNSAPLSLEDQASTVTATENAQTLTLNVDAAEVKDEVESGEGQE